jgi:hypothetical protein
VIAAFGVTLAATAAEEVDFEALARQVTQRPEDLAKLVPKC